jgi:hypothetical protein
MAGVRQERIRFAGEARAWVSAEQRRHEPGLEGSSGAVALGGLRVVREIAAFEAANRLCSTPSAWSEVPRSRGHPAFSYATKCEKEHVE